MNKQVRDARLSQIALEMINEAAETGAPAPSNLAISSKFGDVSVGMPPIIIKYLIARNLIKHIKLSANSRQFMVVATGKLTHPKPGEATVRHVVGRLNPPEITTGITLYTLDSYEMRRALR